MAKKHLWLRRAASLFVILALGVLVYIFRTPASNYISAGVDRFNTIDARFNPRVPVVAKKKTTETTTAATTEDGRAGFEKTTKVFIDPVADVEHMKQQLADAEKSAKAFALEQTKALSEQLASLKAEIAKAKEPAPAAAPAPVAAPQTSPIPAPVVVPQQQSALPAPAAVTGNATNEHIVTPDNASPEDIKLMADVYRHVGPVPHRQRLSGFAKIGQNDAFVCPDGPWAGKPAKLVSRQGESRRWWCPKTEHSQFVR